MTSVPPPLTVVAALGEPALAAAVLVAGRAGLDRTVEAVVVLDVGELDSLRSGQFVLSTALPLRGLDLVELVDRLAGARACALGVKLGTVWRTLPDELVAACETRGLPLVVLPAGRFEEIVHPLLAEIAERQTRRLRATAELHDALTQAALGNAPMEAIAAAVAGVLDAPVGVFDDDAELVAAAGPAADWSAGAIRAHAARATEATAFAVEGVRCLLAPIATVGRRYGAACAIGPHGDEAFARAALVQAAVVCGMQLVGRQRLDAVHRRFERELLEQLLDRSLDREQAVERAERLGWRRRAPYVVVLAGRRPARMASAGSARLTRESAAAFGRALRSHEPPARTFPHRLGLGVVLHLDAPADADAAVGALRRRLSTVQAVPWASEELVLGSSRTRTDVVELPDAAREAALALTASERSGVGSSVVRFDDLGAERLMAVVDDQPRLIAIASETLAPLRRGGLMAVEDLAETLEALLAHNLRIADAARDLFFHYNTVRHRLARLRDVLGDRLADPEQRVALSLALAALRVAALDARLNGAPTNARLPRRPAPPPLPPAR